MKKSMNIKNENGSVLIPALMIMVLLTIMGFSIAATTTMGLKVAVNKKYHKTAFISAESALSYLIGNISLYGNDVITEDVQVAFPPTSDYPTGIYPLTDDQSFKGYVEYTGSRMVPRGSGSEAGWFRAHDYEVVCTGYGPMNSKSVISSAFYRIGY